MDIRIKNYLGIALIIGVLIAGWAAFNFSYSYSRSINPLELPSVTISGEGKVVAIPDVANFSFSVITEGGQNVSQLQTENSRKVNQIIEYLKSQAIAEKDIETKSYTIDPRYQYSSCPREGGICPPPEIVGYTINQTVAVKVRDFNKTGELLGGVVEKGANTVSGLSFVVDDPTKLQDEARAKAIKQAEERAKSVAEAAGVRLGRLLNISEFVSIPRDTFFKEGLGVGGGGPIPFPASPAVEPGQEEIIVTVNLIYEIK